MLNVDLGSVYETHIVTVTKARHKGEPGYVEWRSKIMTEEMTGVRCPFNIQKRNQQGNTL